MAGITAESPNVSNYRIGKGILEMKYLEWVLPDGSTEAGDTDFVDLGNATTISFTPNPEYLDHFSARGGVRQKDLTVVKTMQGEVKFTLEEWNPRNVEMAVLGALGGSGTTAIIDVMMKPMRPCELKFTGMNDVGPRWNFHFFRCVLKPTSSLEMISDEWGNIEITAEALVENGRFGEYTQAFPDFTPPGP